MVDSYSYEEVAARIRVGKSIVRRLVKRGELAVIQVGSSRRIPSTSFDDFMVRKFGIHGRSERRLGHAPDLLTFEDVAVQLQINEDAVRQLA